MPGSESASLTRVRGLRFVPEIYDTVSLRSDAAGVTGKVEAVFGPVASDQVVMIERITVATDSSDPTTATVYLGEVDPGNVLDASPSGNSDVADEVQPILIPAGQRAVIQWVGMNPGTRGYCRLQYQQGRFVQEA